MSDYFKSTAIGSSLLASFVESPDHALMTFTPTWDSQKGKIWEDLVEDFFTSQNREKFFEKYYLSKIDIPATKSKNPAEIFLPVMFESENVPELIAQSYVKTKAGELNKVHKKRHAILDEIVDNKYKFPVSPTIWSLLQQMFENFLNCEYEGIKLENLLYGAEFQTEYFWKVDDIECRAKFDCWTILQDSAGNQVPLCFDLKKSFEEYKFKQMYNNKYIWQDAHYSDAFKRFLAQYYQIEYTGSIIFIVSNDTKPFLTSTYEINSDDTLDRDWDYFQYLRQCWDWIQAKKPKKGWRSTQKLRYYSKLKRS